MTDQRLEKEHALAMKEKEKETIVSQLKASEELNKVLKSGLETVKGDLSSQIMAKQIQENDFKTTLSETEKRFREQERALEMKAKENETMTSQFRASENRLSSELDTVKGELKSQTTARQLEENDFKTTLSKTEKRFKDELNEWETKHKNTTKEHQKSTKEVKALNKEKGILDDKLKDQKKANLELFEKQARLQMEMETYRQSLREATTTIKNNEAVNAKQYTQLQQQRSQLQQHVSTIQQQTYHINQQNKNSSDLETALQKSEEERNKLNLRLSKLAGAHLTRDNPNIADLSDENRPTKLAEKYSELYDNEWRYAFEELCDLPGKDELTSIGEMLDLLKTTYEECVQTSKPHRDTLRNLTTVTLNVNKCPVKDKGQTITDISFEDQCVQTEVTGIDRDVQTDINGYDVDQVNQGSSHTNQLENSDSQSTELSGRRDENDDQALSSNNDNEQNSQMTTDLQSSDTSNIDEPSHEPMECDLAYAEEPTAEEGASPSHEVDDPMEGDLVKAEEPTEEKGPFPTHEVGDQPVEGLDDEPNIEDIKCQGHKEDLGDTEAEVTQTHSKADLREQTEDQQLETKIVYDRQLKHDLVKDTEVPKLPEGFSSNVDTGEITAEIEVRMEFSAEQKKTVSDMIKVCATKLEQEKELSKVIAQKVAFERNIDAEKQTRLMAYITKCAQLCWYMVIQEPPVVIEFQDKVTGEPFNKDVYKAYTKIGNMLDFIVWPPLYLHKKGPMLSKGTAQGTE